MTKAKKTPQGTWEVRWRDHTGRQRSRRFKRKPDAERFAAQTITDLGRGVLPDTASTKQTIAEAADEWLAAAMNLGQGGRDTYRRDLDQYVLPALGDLQLARLRPEDIEGFLSTELERLAASTVHRHYRTIRRLCQVFVDRGKIPRNPCDPVTPPRVEHAEMHFLDLAQVKALADVIGPRYRALILTACFAGLRWSELVGLRRQRVDGGRITVVEQLIRRSDRQWHRDPPKTRAGRRSIAMPAFLAAELDVHLAQWAQPDADGLVFPNKAGRPITGSNFTGMVFKPALQRADISRDVRIHDLRHTAVALAIAEGAHPKAIQARMGHASIAVTLDRYGHLFPEMDETLATNLDRRWAATPTDVRLAG